MLAVPHINLKFSPEIEIENLSLGIIVHILNGLDKESWDELIKKGIVSEDEKASIIELFMVTGEESLSNGCEVKPKR